LKKNISWLGGLINPELMCGHMGFLLTSSWSSPASRFFSFADLQRGLPDGCWLSGHRVGFPTN
jgi:hypothetical protein